jgi:biopolymer transport protein ExbD
MLENIYIMDAIRSLGVDSFSLSGHPTNETEFLSMYKEMTGVDSNNFSIMSSDKSDFSVTWSQVSSKVTELQTEYDNNKYQRDREIEYPKIVDQLDDLYHNGIDGWKTTIKAIKDKYPKE